MSRGAAHAALFLFVFTLVLFAANLLFTAHQVGSLRAVDTAAARNAASIVQLCEAINGNRAQQLILWDHIIAVAHAPPHETPAARAQRLAGLRAFGAFVHKVFAPRNCHAPFSIRN